MSFPLFIGGLGGPELVIIFLIVILLFGANKLPKLARASGEAMGEFQRGREDLEREIKSAASLDRQSDDDVAVEDVEDADADADHDVEADVDRRTPSA